MREKSSYIITRSINGLMHPHHTLGKRYQIVLKVEDYLSTFPTYQGFLTASYPSYSILTLPPVNSLSANGTTSASTFVKSHWIKGHENAPSISCAPSSQIECHHCHAKGHTASLCPQRTLFLNQVNDYISDDDPNIIIIKPLEVANEKDLGLDNDCEDKICASFL
ncbi:Zinc finger, CCHC-type [Parasponia andersonii]|uniref:Zinc finger, CCHC-type n=1 Tax=Parasponia andersonii TaxID=3476 RepID=A0A2P5BXX0_PARAD|nr:Zinc finger, CCHC-type [Parasponia andersonii]